MDQGRGRGTLRLMASSKKESSLRKEKRVTCPSKPNASIGQGQGQGQRRPSTGSTEKQVANYLNKSTKTSTTASNATIKNVKKTGADHTSPSQSHRPNTLRRSSSSRSITTTNATAPPNRKPVISPASPRKPTIIKSASFSSLSSTTGAPKPTVTRLAKNPIAGKSSTLSSSSMTRTKSLKKTPSPCLTTKRGTTTLASKKTPITTHGIKKEAQHLETKHENKENKENSDHQVEEVVKDDDIEIPKAEEETQQNASVEGVDTTTQVKSVEDEEVEEKEKEISDDINTVMQEHKVPESEEMEDKFDERKPDGSNYNNQQHDEDLENDRKEEINVGHDDQEKVPHEETKLETCEDEGVEECCTTEEVANTKESGEEKNDEQIESVKEQTIEEEAHSVDESRIQAEAAQGKKETVEEDANPVAKGRVQEETENGKNETVEEEADLGARTQVETEAANGKEESPTPNSDVVEERPKVVEQRKHCVRALVGEIETRR